MSKVLIVADIEDKCAATPRGLKLAETMGWQPEVVAFTYANLRKLKVDTATGAEIKKQLMAERRATIEARVEKFAGINHKVKVQVVWAENLYAWINKRVTTGDYAAVVKSRHQSESIGHTSTDWHLLRECSAPVLLVGKKKWKKGASVLATVDLDASSRVKQALNVAVVNTANAFAQALGAQLSVLCVIDVPTLLADLDLVDPKSYAKQRKAELEPVLAKLAEATGVPAKQFVTKRGPVAKTIVSEASDKNAQLVVMGTVGRRGVKATVLGNTAEGVLSLLKSDTLTIKP